MATLPAVTLPPPPPQPPVASDQPPPTAVASPAAPPPPSQSPLTPSSSTGNLPASSETVTITIPSCSSWFSWDEVHETERRLLPEFFGEAAASSATRSPSSYKYYRDEIIKRFRRQPSRRLTLTEARRGLVGDVGSIRRVFDFLEEWGLINHGALTAKEKKEKKEELVVVERKEEKAAVVKTVTPPKKLCTGCRAMCGLAYFASEKVMVIFHVFC